MLVQKFLTFKPSLKRRLEHKKYINKSVKINFRKDPVKNAFTSDFIHSLRRVLL